MRYLAIKKTFYHPKADLEAREDFQTTLQGYETPDTPIIYVDESGFAHDMPRLYGYSAKGQRCYRQHDWHAKARTNVIGAQLNGKLTTVCTSTAIPTAIFFRPGSCKTYYQNLPKGLSS